MFEPAVQTHSDALAVLERLAAAALKNWGIDPREIRLLKFRENAVFKVLTTENERYALRIHRGGYHSDNELRSELQWMTALQAHGVDVPAIVPLPDGSLFVSVHVDGLSAPLQVDLFEWIEGGQLGTAENGLGDDLKNIEGTYRTIGNIAARLHNQAATWQLPEGFERHAWDMAGLVGENPFWGRFWEFDALSDRQRETLLTARDIVRSEMIGLAESVDLSQHYGLIHADFVPENLFVSDGKVRLLDFDDAGFGWHLFELATALYFIQEEPNFETAKAALVAGYREYRDLSDAMLAKLPVFMMARGFTYLGWVHTRPGSEEGKALAPYLTRLACGFADRFVSEWPPLAESA